MVNLTMAGYHFSIKKSLEKLNKELNDIPPSIEGQINQAIKDIAHATFAEITSKAQAELHSTRADYLKALEFQQIGSNSYLISLDGGWANKLEEGFEAYNLTEVLLRSKKMVEVGRRSGQPWVQKAKEDGHKFAYVPFERQPFSKEPKAADLGAAIRQMTAVNRKGRVQKLTSVFKDEGGAPMEGLVAIARSSNPLLDNLVKYQKNYINEKTGKVTTQSVYINYRAVSEIAKPWIHPGFSGLHAFDDAAKSVEKHLDMILKELLGG